MTHVYILAHFDDELGVLPLMMARQKQGCAQKFIYVATYQDDVFEVRKRETETMLCAHGWAKEDVFTLKTKVMDGSLYEHPLEIYEDLATLLQTLGPIEGLTTTAWEGGHHDHDVCATLTVCLGRALGVETQQFSLYNGKNLPWRLFRGAWPLEEGGPRRTIKLGLQDWLRVLSAVRFYPSQWRTWIGLWPAMVAGFLCRGFTYQDLNLKQLMQRPHSGALLYERMFQVDYGALRPAIDRLLQATPGSSTQ